MANFGGCAFRFLQISRIGGCAFRFLQISRIQWADLVKGSNFFRSKKFDRKFDRKVRSFELFENIKSSNDRTFSNSKKFDHSNFLKVRSFELFEKQKNSWLSWIIDTGTCDDCVMYLQRLGTLRNSKKFEQSNFFYFQKVRMIELF